MFSPPAYRPLPTSAFPGTYTRIALASLLLALTACGGNTADDNDSSSTANSYTLGGTVSGLQVSGLSLSNGADTISVTANATSFTMDTPVAYGASYTIAVATQPWGYTCLVSGGSGTMPAANVSSVAVSCTQNPVYAYSANYNDPSLILQYTIDLTTNLPSTAPVSSVSTGSGSSAKYVVANATGTMLYATDYVQDVIYEYSINPANGNLSCARPSASRSSVNSAAPTAR